MKTYTAIIHQEIMPAGATMFVAECAEIGTVSQGETIALAIANLKEATELYLEEFPMPQISRPLLTTFEIENA
jgi:predicted RNase H-like HicB family nuclease